MMGSALRSEADPGGDELDPDEAPAKRPLIVRPNLEPMVLEVGFVSEGARYDIPIYQIWPHCGFSL